MVGGLPRRPGRQVPGLARPVTRQRPGHRARPRTFAGGVMAKGYIIGHITVTDPEGYPEYVRRDTPILEKHGAKFIVRGGQSQTPEGTGTGPPRRHRVPDLRGRAGRLQRPRLSGGRRDSPPLRRQHHHPGGGDMTDADSPGRHRRSDPRQRDPHRQGQRRPDAGRRRHAAEALAGPGAAPAEDAGADADRAAADLHPGDLHRADRGHAVPLGREPDRRRDPAAHRRGAGRLELCQRRRRRTSRSTARSPPT